jgi:hypothetical protein
VGDLDGDGHDEIVAGFRGKGFQLYCFRLEKGRWVKRVLDDGGMAAADCKFLGPQTLACNGATTGNVKIYSRK